MAANRSKKSKMILVRASDSTLMGINVENASRAKFESSHRCRSETHVPRWSKGGHTLFANFKEFVSFPSDYSAGQSAPAPFHNTTKDLRHDTSHISRLSQARPMTRGQRRILYHGLNQPQLLHQRVATQRRAVFLGVEKAANKGASGTWV